MIDQLPLQLLPDVDAPKADPDDIKLWSVTTILKVLASPAIDYWSKEQVAKALVGIRGSLAKRVEEDGEEEVIKWGINATYRKPKNERSATQLGTDFHLIGEEIGITGKHGPVDAELAPLVYQYEKWLDKAQPTFLAAEMPIYSLEYGYAGTCDGGMELQGERLIFDYKGLDVTTPIPTPAGWKTMAEIQVGDMVFGSDGIPCTVIGKSEVHQKPCRRVMFDDNTSIVCDNEHLWFTKYGHKSRKGTYKYGVHSTDFIMKTVKKSGGQSSHMIPVASPLQLPTADLPIHPYIYGLWLGDGTRTSGTITNIDNHIWDRIKDLGFTITEPTENMTKTIHGLRKLLRKNNLLGHKVVPDIYLRASENQRLELLRGLMDSDGSWNIVRNQAVFVNTDKHLALVVQELVRSLGSRATLIPYTAHGFGITRESYFVNFTPSGWNPFFTPTKSDKVRLSGTAMSRRHMIVDVIPTVIVPTQCIMVDSPDNTYLCGDQMIPTHNTSKKSFDKQGQPTHAYPEVALQLSAYRHAQWAVPVSPRRWEQHGRRYYLFGNPERDAAIPVPEFDGGIVIHVTPEHCDAYVVRCDEEIHRAFLYVHEASRWANETSKTAIGNKLIFEKVA